MKPEICLRVCERKNRVLPESVKRDHILTYELDNICSNIIF